MLRSTIAGLCAATLLLASCRETAAPRPVIEYGMYSLKSVNMAPLGAATAIQVPNGMLAYVDAGHFKIDVSNWLMATEMTELVARPWPPAAHWSEFFPQGNYSFLPDGTLRLDWKKPADWDSDRPPVIWTATVTGRTIDVRRDGRVYRYVKD